MTRFVCASTRWFRWSITATIHDPRYPLCAWRRPIHPASEQHTDHLDHAGEVFGEARRRRNPADEPLHFILY
jgi:hypothetical protein